MKKILFTLITCCFMSAVLSNNISVTNVSLSGQNTSTHTVIINFDVAWENSWRTSTNESNYDGAWVFVKFKKNGTYDWRHCHINPSGFIANPSATMLVPTADSMGAFIYHTTDFIGNVNYTGNQLIWNYAADGVADNNTVEIDVFAVEMVYIPTGSYYLGSGGTENNSFRKGNTTAPGEPYHVTNADSISIGNTGNDLNFAGAVSGTIIPAAFPNAYNAYWIMKYECSQQQYANFLNHIELAQATALKTSGTNIFGDAVWPNFQPAVADRAYNYTSISENNAFADWAGLRPLSEMEFEKACRGANILPVANEYAWGNTNIIQLSTVINADQPEESVGTPSNANAVYCNSNGTCAFTRPVRVGLFARPVGSGVSTRERSGATYYGVMNMSDNLYEFTVNCSSNQGQSVNAAVHGNGYLQASGFTDISAWQQPAAFGVRGGRFSGEAGSLGELRVSERGNAIHVDNGGSVAKGIRLVRTAP